jgi:hypothetical protein
MMIYSGIAATVCFSLSHPKYNFGRQGREKQTVAPGTADLALNRNCMPVAPRSGALGTAALCQSGRKLVRHRTPRGCLILYSPHGAVAAGVVSATAMGSLPMAGQHIAFGDGSP